MVDVETGSRIEYEPEHIDSIRELGMITTSAGDGQEMKTHFHDLREFAMVSMPAGHADTLSEPIAVVAWRAKETQTSTPESLVHQRFVHSVGGAHQHEEAAPDPDGAYESSHQRLLSNLTSLPGNLNVVNKACIKWYDDLQKWVVPVPFTLLVLHYRGNERTVVNSICRQSGVPMQSCDLANFEKIWQPMTFTDPDTMEVSRKYSVDMFTWRLLGRREYHQALEDSQDQIAIGMSMARELRAALSTSAAFEFVESTIAELELRHFQ